MLFTRFLPLTLCLALLTIAQHSYSQCYFPANTQGNDTVSFTFSGGAFASYGCLPIDPTFWLNGSGITATITFSSPVSNPSFRVWGMNDDDSASVSVNGSPYALHAGSASFDTKVVCGQSPGPDGVAFANGKLVGANDNVLGNYSYQNVTLNTASVTSITITGVSGAGWGFAGVTIDCNSNPCPPMTFNYSLTNATPGADDGAVKVNVSGGQPPYLYSLDGVTYQESSTFTALAPGTYAVFVTDSNGCPAQGTFTLAVDTALALQPLHAAIDVQVFPNPFAHQLTVRLNTRGTVVLRMMNLLGKVVYATPGSIAAGAPLLLNMDGASLPAGMYVIEISAGATTQVIPVIKQ